MKSNDETIAQQAIRQELSKLKHNTEVKLFITGGHIIEGKFISISHQGIVSVLISQNNKEQGFENKQIATIHAFYIYALSQFVN